VAGHGPARPRLCAAARWLTEVKQVYNHHTPVAGPDLRVGLEPDAYTNPNPCVLLKFACNCKRSLARLL
jgi:hypothetical protein